MERGKQKIVLRAAANKVDEVDFEGFSLEGENIRGLKDETTRTSIVEKLMEILVNQNGKIHLVEDIRKLRIISNNLENCKQISIEVRELKNNIKDHEP